MGIHDSLDSDRELVLKARAGSLEAFETLVLRYEGRLYRFLLELGLRPEDAREATQDAFISAYRALDRFDLKHEVTPWLFTIARRKAIDASRRLVRRGTEPLEEDVPCIPMTDAAPVREEGISIWEQARDLLKETHYQALWLHYAEELTVAQIAHVLGKTCTHVKVILFRARRVLRSKLEHRDGNTRARSDEARPTALAQRGLASDSTI